MPIKKLKTLGTFPRLTVLSGGAVIVSAPDVPTGLAVTGASGGIVADLTPEYTWNAVTGAVTYDVQRNTVQSESGVTTFSDLAITSYVELSNLAINTYYVRVRATNAGGDSDWSSWVAFTTIVQISFSAVPDGALPAPLAGATWSVASGVAKNTPTESTTKIVNGGFETAGAGGADVFASWTEGVAGTSTVNLDTAEQRTGANCARLDVDGSNSQVQITQAPTGVAVGDFVRLVGYSKANVGAKSLYLELSNQRNSNNFYTLTTSYVEHALCSYIMTLSGINAILRRGGTNSFSIYLDDYALNVLTKNTLFSTVDCGTADGIVKANWTVTTGTLAGVVMNLDSVSNPQNFVLLLVNGATGNYFLWKVVAGTLTQVATGASNYVAGTTVELRKTGTTYQVFYNGAQKGTDQTISDAGIVSNTIHGNASMDYRNVCSFFSAA